MNQAPFDVKLTVHSGTEYKHMFLNRHVNISSLHCVKIRIDIITNYGLSPIDFKMSTIR